MSGRLSSKAGRDGFIRHNRGSETCALRFRGKCELDRPTQFQTISGTSRTCLELCMDLHLLTGPRAVDRAAEKFHAFTSAARFESAWNTVRFCDSHPELSAPEFVAERRALAEIPGKAEMIESLCRELWSSRRCPKHWSGLQWREVASHIGLEMEARAIEWFNLYAWHVHGGGAGVGGLDKDSFESIEVLCRVEVRKVACDALGILASALSGFEALPHLRERIRFIRNDAVAASLIDQRLQLLGRVSRVTRHVAGI